MKLSHSIAILSALPSTLAWGELGHRTVAYLAAKYLTPAARDLVSTLLANDQGWDISDAAVWADTVRKKPEYSHTGHWHFIDAEDDPPRFCNVSYTRDCHPDAGCIVSAIANMTERITDPTLEFPQQKDALMFILHFLGDIHQPLHTELLSYGGNGIPVCFDNRCIKQNLHGTWDRDIPHKWRGLPANESDIFIIKAAAQEWASSLVSSAGPHAITPESLRASECSDLDDAQGCALAWASESNRYICGYVLRPGVDWIKQNDLGGEYYAGAVPVVEYQVRKAGFRLAGWLNAIAGPRKERVGGGWVGEQESMEM